MRRRKVAQRSVRRGAILALALACLLAVILFGGTMLRQLMQEMRASRATHQQHQASWLAQAGIDRAAAKLKEDPEYTGETWRPADDAFPDPRQAEVTIVVERMIAEDTSDDNAGDESNAFQVTATATFGRRLATGVTAKRQRVIALPTKESP